MPSETLSALLMNMSVKLASRCVDGLSRTIRRFRLPCTALVCACSWLFAKPPLVSWHSAWPMASRAKAGRSIVARSQCTAFTRSTLADASLADSRAWDYTPPGVRINARFGELAVCSQESCGRVRERVAASQAGCVTGRLSPEPMKSGAIHIAAREH